MANRPQSAAAAPAVVQSSALEPWIIRTLCEPVLKRLPRSIAPNTISLTTHLLWWVVAALAVASPSLSATGRTLALLGAGLGTLAATVTDCLDGMQARRTGRCSKLGEMLDHWLDAIHVPLLTVGLLVALGVEPWAVAAVHITGAMVFNAQLVLQQQSGSFVHPTTSGTEATFGAAIGYALLGLALLLFERAAPSVGIAIHVAAAIAIAVQVRLNLFYYRKLMRGVVGHLPFVLFCGAFAALYLLGAIGELPFLFSIVFVSFRISGSFVLSKIIGRDYAGFDLGLGLWLVAIAASHLVRPHQELAGISLPNLLTLLCCGYLIARNLHEFARHFPSLRAGAPAVDLPAC